jgi:hypothetical protein
VTGSDAVERKVIALRIRQRIESLATSQWALFSGEDYDTLSHSNISLRLHLMVGRVPLGEQHRMHGVVIALVHAYRSTSNMIHGRSNAATVEQIQFEEWKELLDFAEAAVTNSAPHVH